MLEESYESYKKLSFDHTFEYHDRNRNMLQHHSMNSELSEMKCRYCRILKTIHQNLEGKILLSEQILQMMQYRKSKAAAAVLNLNLQDLRAFRT